MARKTTLREALPGLWRILLHGLPYLRQHRWMVLTSLLMLIAETSLRLLEPWPLKFVFDRVFAMQDGSFSIPALDSIGPFGLLTLAAVALVAISGLRALADYFHKVTVSLVGNQVLTQMRDELYRHLQGLSMSFHTKSRSGELVLRLLSDVTRLKEVTITAALPLLASAMTLVGIVTLMFFLHWQLTLVALATVPLFSLSTMRITKRMRESAREQRHREGMVASSAAEAIAAIKIVQSLSLEGRFADTFSSHSRKSQREELKAGRLSAKLERRINLVTALGTATVLWYGAWLVLRQAMSPGDLLVFLVYLEQAYGPVEQFTRYTGRLAKASAAGDRVLDLLHQTPEVHDLPGAVTAPAFQGAVRFNRVSFAYESGRNVLDQIEFETLPGQHVALVGPSGIGKSTLLSLLLRLYDPDQGRVMIDGRDIREYTLLSLRRQIGVVLQDSVLFATSVRENIGWGAPDATPEEVEAAARLANAHDFIMALPEGYDTVVGERGATLSGGQRQRIAIARAAIRKAPILILDEPTTGLDEENQKLVLDALKRVAAGCTTYFISHDLHWAATADVILYLEGGRVRESGTHRELMLAGGRYAHSYRLQAATWSQAPHDGLRRSHPADARIPMSATREEN